MRIKKTRLRPNWWKLLGLGIVTIIGACLFFGLASYGIDAITPDLTITEIVVIIISIPVLIWLMILNAIKY